MQSIKDSRFFREAFQELNYSFGDFYLFEHFVVAEIKKDIVFNWKEHAKTVVEDLSDLYEQDGKDIIYISNRINDYSVVPTDWIHFFKFSYSLKGYYIVSKNGKAMQNTLLEKLFFKSKMQTFNNLDKAIICAKKESISSEDLLRAV